MDLDKSVFVKKVQRKNTCNACVLCYNNKMMARWLSWLERRPVTAEVRGSNPLRVAQFHILFILNGILAQLGEHLPYKQRVTGSSPVGPIFYSLIFEYADVAQLAEQLICNQQVNGSSPLIGSIEAEVLIDFCFFYCRFHLVLCCISYICELTYS